MAKHTVTTNKIQSNNGTDVEFEDKALLPAGLGYDDFTDDEAINKRSIREAIFNINPEPIAYDVPVNTQLVDYGKGWAYRIPNTFTYSVGIVVSSNGTVNFVPYDITPSNIDVYLPDVDSVTGLTTQPYIITVTGINTAILPTPAGVNKYQIAATYNAMTASGPPAVMTTYLVTADENNLGATTEYNYYPNGTIMLQGSNKVN